jgi:hypothetical protein
LAAVSSPYCSDNLLAMSRKLSSVHDSILPGLPYVLSSTISLMCPCISGYFSSFHFGPPPYSRTHWKRLDSAGCDNSFFPRVIVFNTNPIIS